MSDAPVEYRGCLLKWSFRLDRFGIGHHPHWAINLPAANPLEPRVPDRGDSAREFLQARSGLG